MNNVKNITAVIVWHHDLVEEVQGILDVPVFHISEELAVTEISNQIKKLVHNIDEKS